MKLTLPYSNQDEKGKTEVKKKKLLVSFKCCNLSSLNLICHLFIKIFFYRFNSFYKKGFFFKCNLQSLQYLIWEFWENKKYYQRMICIKGGFWPSMLFFTDSDSSWWADSDYVAYIVFWISLRGPNLALKLSIWLNFDSFKNRTWSFLVSFVGKSTSLIMKMILVFYQNISFGSNRNFKGSY